MKGFKKKSLALLCAVIMSVVGLGGLVGCGSDPISNESTRLVLTTQALDGVFNPFYSASVPDSNIVGMTQLGMLTSTSDGKIAYGDDEACLVYDYEETVAPDNSKTTYKFVLKNNVKFSNGSPVTMKDVLFNLYVYLDPMYYGSSTVYSTDIVGLKEYRTQQSAGSAEIEYFESIYLEKGIRRLQRLNDMFVKIYKNNVSYTDEEMKAEIKKYEQEFGQNSNKYSKDYEQAKYRLKTVAESTWNASEGTAKDIKHYDDNKKEYTLNTDAEAFLYKWGIITWNEKENKFENAWAPESSNWSKQQVLDGIYKRHVPNKMTEVIQMYAYEDLVSDLTAFEKQDYFDNLEDSDKVKNIRGITFANLGKSVEVKSQKTGITTTYPAINKDADYNADGSIKTGNYEVLQIEVEKVDPKAIWNFSFPVAPMYYYSNSEQIGLFDYEEHFGIKFGDRDFMDNVIKSPDKIGLPVGAGVYKATTRTGDSKNVTPTTFSSDNVVYFERNEHFMFPSKIKYVNYQVVASRQMLTSLFSGDVHFVEPELKDEYVQELDRKSKDGFSYATARSNGYGYIGINASKVPDLSVRKAIMHAISTDLMVSYFGANAQKINRSMSRANWAYPEYNSREPEDVHLDSYVENDEQYYEFDETGDTSYNLVYEDGYRPSGRKNSEGVAVLQKKGHYLKYTFTVSGETEDHPAFTALFRAAQILNKKGFDIEVKTDINALKKLSTGDLAVWAAAWSSTIDPDMYQVYHKYSTAGAVKNWGYNAILSRPDKYPEETKILADLSDKIDAGRETLTRYGEGGRKDIYAQALKLVMDLAVELPAYQRSDLFAYNSSIIDKSTLITTAEQGLSPFNGPLSKMWLLSFNETK